MPDIPEKTASATSSEAEPREIPARSSKQRRDGRGHRHRRQNSGQMEPQVAVNQVVDDSELLGALLEGIGRVTVGTIAMRRDDAGRWRIRRGSGSDGAEHL